MEALSEHSRAVLTNVHRMVRVVRAAWQTGHATVLINGMVIWLISNSIGITSLLGGLNSGIGRRQDIGVRR